MADDKVYRETLDALREWGYDYATAHEAALQRAQRAAVTGDN